MIQIEKQLILHKPMNVQTLARTRCSLWSRNGLPACRSSREATSYLRAGPHRCNEVLTRLSLASHVPVSLTARPSSSDQQGYSFNDYMSFCSYCMYVQLTAM